MLAPMRNMALDPDEDLVARVGEGDERAARALVQRHLPRMLALARRMLRNSAEAEDVAQDVFLRVWKHAKRWRAGEAKFDTWLHRVAINLCYDRLRRKPMHSLDAAPDPVDPAPRPGDALAARQVSRVVEEALVRLPERQRAAIVLCHYQELGNIEAAKALGVSIEALESLLSRGRRALREMLKDRVPELLAPSV